MSKKEYYQINKERILQKAKEQYESDKSNILNRNAEWRKNNPQWIQEYRKTKLYKAHNLLHCYIREDRKYERIGDELPSNYIAAQWIVDNIFTKKCAHCNETDWHKLGCNRLDNSKPHTMDNVEPCCKKCNDRLAANEKVKPIDQISPMDGEIVHSFFSYTEAAKAGFIKASEVANGNRKQNNGYIFKYVLI